MSNWEKKAEAFVEKGILVTQVFVIAFFLGLLALLIVAVAAGGVILAHQIFVGG